MRSCSQAPPRFRGSLPHAIAGETQFLVGLTVLLVSVLSAGQLHRGQGGIGFEGVAILGFYAGGMATLVLS